MGTEPIHRLKSLYFGPQALPHKDEILQAVTSRKPMPGIYLITFAANGVDQLDILPLYVACLQMKKKGIPLLAGIGMGREDAFETVQQIAEDAYRATGSCHLQEFLLARDGKGT